LLRGWRREELQKIVRKLSAILSGILGFHLTTYWNLLPYDWTRKQTRDAQQGKPALLSFSTSFVTTAAQRLSNMA
jgi:hypothetical protein